MRHHNLRTDPDPFQQVWLERQTFQIRPDNEYEVGDQLTLQETIFPTEDRGICSADYTGREIDCDVTSVMRGPIYGLNAGWVAMSISVFFKSKHNSESR